MTRHPWLLSCLLVAGCATVGAPFRGGSHELRGALLLSDGTPVARAPLVLSCGTLSRRVSTDERGGFVVSGLPAGSCRVSSPGAGLEETVSVGSNLLRGELRLRLPPVHRVALEWSVGGKSGSALLDETLPHPLELAGHRVALAERALLCDGRRLAAASALAGQRFQVEGLTLKVTAVEARPYLPLALRPAARPGALTGVPLLAPDGQLAQLGLGPRNLLLIGSCDHLRADLLDQLEGLAAAFGPAGLRVAAILSEPCARPPARADLPVLLGGPEARWAVGARPGELLVLDGEGRRLLRRPARQLGAVDDARGFLERSWPPATAAIRVSVAPAPSVVEAEADRLLAQAEARSKAGKHMEAHALLDQVLKLAPDLAEARKQRALTKARLGDLSGAMNEVSWWRTSFGAESADDLLDEVQRCAKVSTLH